MKALRTASITILATLIASPLWAEDVPSAVSNGVDQSLSPVQPPAEAASGGLPQFDPHKWPGQVFWLAIAFTIMYLFFSKKTLPNIAGVLDNRRDHIRSDIDAAERLRAEAVQAETTYEKLMADARAESTRLMVDAATQTKAESDRKLAALKDKGVADGAALETHLDAARKTAKAEMHDQIAEIASAAAEKIVGIKPDLGRASSLVQSLKGKEAA